MEENQSPISSFRSLRISLLIVAFCTGSVILMEELLLSGWMAPLFGSGIEVWASILGVTLFMMALGYFAGSWSSSKVQFYHLPHLLCASGISILISSFLVPPFFQNHLGNYSYFSMVCFSFSILGIPVFLLSMVSPWLIQFYSQTNVKAGESSGILYAVSTLGGVVGALGCGFWGIPYQGLSKTTLFCGWILVVAIFNCVQEKKTGKGTIAVGIFLILAILFAQTIRSKSFSLLGKPKNLTLLIKQDSLYGQKAVYEDVNRRHLIVNGILQTGMPKRGIRSMKKGAFLKSGYVMELLPYFRPLQKKTLIIGLGGGLLSTFFLKYGWNITSVELDPAMVSLARKYFYFKEKCKVQDGRVFLHQNKKKYDFLILDVYQGEHIPSHMTTLEFYQLAKSRLTSSGILAINLIGTIHGKDTGALLKTIQMVFKNLALYTPYKGFKLGLMTLFVSKKKLNHDGVLQKLQKKGIFIGKPLFFSKKSLEKFEVLTDDRNPIALLRKKTARQWRKITQNQYFWKEKP